MLWKTRQNKTLNSSYNESHFVCGPEAVQFIQTLTWYVVSATPYPNQSTTKDSLGTYCMLDINITVKMMTEEKWRRNTNKNCCRLSKAYEIKPLHKFGRILLGPALGRSPGEENGSLLQYSGLENSMHSPWGQKESDTTERLALSLFTLLGS